MMLSRVCRIPALCALAVLAAGPIAASAQDAPDRQRIGWFAADVRGVFARHPHDPAIATFLAVEQDNVPERGLGLAVGAHLYPLRGRVVALGVGGEMLWSRASKTQPAATEGGDEGPTVKSRLKALSPQLSLNFGHRQGWSYITGGLGWSELELEVVDAAVLGPPAGTSGGLTALAPAEPERTRTLNYGGGARWFMKKHLAFTLDLRFYVVGPKEATAAGPALPRTRLVMMSGGISMK